MRPEFRVMYIENGRKRQKPRNAACFWKLEKARK